MAVRSPFRVIQLVLPANKFYEFVIFGKKKKKNYYLLILQSQNPSHFINHLKTFITGQTA